uniref:Uncharacterized protein n=1 Tax=Opuntia streptacantha TaxID=393608 RepID=A0A7C9EHB5_OPUST
MYDIHGHTKILRINKEFKHILTKSFCRRITIKVLSASIPVNETAIDIKHMNSLSHGLQYIHILLVCELNRLRFGRLRGHTATGPALSLQRRGRRMPERRGPFLPRFRPTFVPSNSREPGPLW